MKLLKKPLRKLLHDHGNFHERVTKLRVELDAVQIALDKDPYNDTLREEEAVYLTAFNEAKVDEERFLKQKANVDWLEVGDSNSAYFHKTIKGCNQRSRIEVIRTADNVELTGPCVPNCFVEHYQEFLGTDDPCIELDSTDLFMKHVSDMSCAHMTRPVTNEEVNKAMFDIGDDKSPGPDGYSSVFFKEGWDTIGNDVCNAVATPMKVNDYRPISCCNVIYKCISKILTNRIIDGIKEIVSENQFAFILGRRISDNILITQELMRNYHHNSGPLASFSLSINEDIHGYFQGKRGLRQGDPLSPYLFTLVMEVLTLIIQRRVRISDTFRYHHHCDDLQIINICFADDLFLFTYGELDSAKLIMDALDEFKMVLGLVPSLPKSTAFFCGVSNHVKASILNIMPFHEEELPVKYLGVPLISSRLLNKDCKILVEKVQN
ncbi:protein LAZ1 [Tanacetum coccineum]|uniref:Protein LAZ1 n=1 Tax=Tanacetum coccineum TaxID=301880 RepID=A0ABQ5F1C7_9ASTR